MLGGVVCCTIMTKEQDVVRLYLFVAEQVTVVEPNENRFPEAGKHDTVGATPDGSDAAGRAKVAGAEGKPPIGDNC